MTRRDLGCLAAIGAVLLVTDVVLTQESPALTVPVAAVATVAVILLARHHGLDRGGFGFAAGTTRRGLLWAMWSALAVAAVVAAFAALPWSSPLFDDDGLPRSLTGALVTVGFVVPVRTVLLEELAFRGALWGLLERRLGHIAATAWSSAAFGLWHVPDALRLARENAAAHEIVGSSPWASAVLVAVVVVATGLAGVVFCELRRRSGSLLAPLGFHWAVNSATTIASVVVRHGP